jgi:hypothetical protein
MSELAKRLAMEHFSAKYNPSHNPFQSGNYPALAYDAAVDAIDEALEEAAKVAIEQKERSDYPADCSIIARRIRALKSQ